MLTKNEMERTHKINVVKLNGFEFGNIFEFIPRKSSNKVGKLSKQEKNGGKIIRIYVTFN